MCLEKSSSRAWSATASATASLKCASLWARNGRHPDVQALFSSQRSVIARAAHSAEEPLRSDSALEAADDGHVAGLQVRRCCGMKHSTM